MCDLVSAVLPARSSVRLTDSPLLRVANLSNCYYYLLLTTTLRPHSDGLIQMSPRIASRSKPPSFSRHACSVLRAACCTLRVACCVHATRCTLHDVRRVLLAACYILHATCRTCSMPHLAGCPAFACVPQGDVFICRLAATAACASPAALPPPRTVRGQTGGRVGGQTGAGVGVQTKEQYAGCSCAPDEEGGITSATQTAVQESAADQELARKRASAQGGAVTGAVAGEMPEASGALMAGWFVKKGSGFPYSWRSVVGSSQLAVSSKQLAVSS